MDAMTKALLGGFNRARKKPTLLTMALLVGVLLSPLAQIASAEALVCFPKDTPPQCFHSDGDCSNFGTPNDWPDATCTNIMHVVYNLNSDYILSSGGRTWVVTGGKKSLFISDGMLTFFQKERGRYAREWNDPRVRRQVSADTQAFLREDNGFVSPNRLRRFSEQTKLRILTKEVVTKSAATRELRPAPR